MFSPPSTTPPTARANAGALRMEWPSHTTAGLARWSKSPSLDAATLARSAARGRELARLLDPDTPRPWCHPRLHCVQSALAIAVPSTSDGRNMSGDDFARSPPAGAVSGAGRSGDARVRVTYIERNYTPKERDCLG